MQQSVNNETDGGFLEYYESFIFPHYYLDPMHKKMKNYSKFKYTNYFSNSYIPLKKK